jgi:hypothetical protein
MKDNLIRDYSMIWLNNITAAKDKIMRYFKLSKHLI